MAVTFSKPLVYGNIILFGIVIGVAIIFGARQVWRDFKRKPFEPKIAEYSSTPQGNLQFRQSAPKDSIAIAGKLVPVNLDKKTIDPLLDDLPDKIRPNSPDEVKTIMWIACTASEYGKYTDGRSGKKNDCVLTFIDKANNQFLWKDLITVYPPDVKKGGYDAEVPDPAETIVSYLASVPDRD